MSDRELVLIHLERLCKVCSEYRDHLEKSISLLKSNPSRRSDLHFQLCIFDKVSREVDQFRSMIDGLEFCSEFINRLEGLSLEEMLTNDDLLIRKVALLKIKSDSP